MNKVKKNISLVVLILVFGCQNNSFEDEAKKESDKAISMDLPSLDYCNRQLALQHISNRTPVLIVRGGIAPILYASDDPFTIKYGVALSSTGCTLFQPEDSIISYNEAVFQYLDLTFG